MSSAKQSLFRSALTIAAFLLGGALGGIDKPREKPPNIMGRTLDGQPFNSASLKGKTVLVQFWATWCPRCREEQPAIDTLAREFAGRGLVVLAVNVGESRKKVTEYLAKSPRACYIVMAEETNMAAVFKPRAYPLYVLLGPDGAVAATQPGAGGENALRQLLRRAGLGPR